MEKGDQGQIAGVRMMIEGEQQKGPLGRDSEETFFPPFFILLFIIFFFSTPSTTGDSLCHHGKLTQAGVPCDQFC